jgi:hypothetical protein
MTTGCGESWERTVKDLDSEYAGGLNRTITVYDQNGQAIKQYKGKVDIRDSEYGNKVLFDLDGKRVVIYNAVVVAEEN